MKLKALSAAIVAAGVLASPAFALNPDVPADINLYIAGASAQDKLLQSLFVDLCDAGTLDVFSDVGVSKPEGTSYSGAYCRMTESVVGVDFNGDGDTVDNVTRTVFLHKRSAGGSAQGVVPVANNAPITFMNITAANCAGAPQGTAAGSSHVAGAPVWRCDVAQLASTTPDGGIADVEPALFVGPNAIGSFDVNNLTATGMNAVTFGIAVTKNLRDSLQAAQGKTIGSDDVTQMPSLSHSQIASIFAGNPAQWTVLKVRNTDTNAIVPLTQVGTFGAGLAAGLTAPANTRVSICTRTQGSGTRAQFGALFHNNPCDPNSPLGVNPDNTSASPTTGGTGVTTPILGANAAVHENSGSGDLDNCLANLNTGNWWGIGYQSVEKANAGWRFLAIDGYAPTLKNVAENKYFDWVATSMQWRSASSANPAAGVKLGLMQKIANEAAKPAKLAVENATFSNADFITGTNSEVGYLALPKTFTGSVPFSVANPVATATRSGTTDSSAPSSCRKPAIRKDVLVGA